MRCIQLSSSVGCSRVPQVHFVRKQIMCKSVYTYLTICFAFEKPRWLLHNTADRAETVFSHLNRYFGILVSFAIECISGHISSSHSLHAALLKTAIEIEPIERRSPRWKNLKSSKFLRFSVIVSVKGSLPYIDVT